MGLLRLNRLRLRQIYLVEPQSLWVSWLREGLNRELGLFELLLDLLRRVAAHAVEHVALAVEHESGSFRGHFVRRSRLCRHCLAIKLGLAKMFT